MRWFFRFLFGIDAGSFIDPNGTDAGWGMDPNG